MRRAQQVFSDAPAEHEGIGMAMARDGSLVVSAAMPEWFGVFARNGASPSRRLERASSGRLPRFTADGLHLAIPTGDGRFVIEELASGATVSRPYLAPAAEEPPASCGLTLAVLTHAAFQEALATHAPLTASADGRTLLVASPQGEVLLLRSGAGRIARYEGPVARKLIAGRPRLSPDGSMLLIRERGLHAELLALPDLTPEGTFVDCGPDVRALAWSPDGTRVLIANLEGTVSLHQAAPARVQGELSIHERYTRRALWTTRLEGCDHPLECGFRPDGASAWVSNAGCQQVLELSRGAVIDTLSVPVPLGGAVSFSPDGAWYVGTPRVARTLVLARPFSAPREVSWLPPFAVSPDGRQVLARDAKGTLAVHPVRGEPPAVGLWPDSPGARVAYGPTGIVYTSLPRGPLEAFRPAGKRTGADGERGEKRLALAVSPDGSRLANLDMGGVELFDAVSLARLGRVPVPATWAPAEGLVFGLDGTIWAKGTDLDDDYGMERLIPLVGERWGQPWELDDPPRTVLGLGAREVLTCERGAGTLRLEALEPPHESVVLGHSPKASSGCVADDGSVAAVQTADGATLIFEIA